MSAVMRSECYINEWSDNQGNTSLELVVLNITNLGSLNLFAIQNPNYKKKQNSAELL